MRQDFRRRALCVLLPSATPGITGTARTTSTPGTSCAAGGSTTAAPLTERFPIRQSDGDKDSARSSVQEPVRVDLDVVASLDG